MWNMGQKEQKSGSWGFEEKLRHNSYVERSIDEGDNASTTEWGLWNVGKLVVEMIVCTV